ncbi:MAG TPA: LysE family transporter [Candidatus Sulfotelmatobacter sp.]|nr:LysE family transporter [Candidatus Sulfotelmatobacter sp.]
MFSLLLRGFVFGFAIAAAPGPVFFLCLRRTLVQGRAHGLLSGLGVATADGFYATVATFGVAAAMTVFLEIRRPLEVIGFVGLAALGTTIILQRPRPDDAQAAPSARGLAWAYLSTAGVTLANPATILSFAALAATLGVGTGGSGWRPALVAAGVSIGSMAWWCLLVLAASWLRPRLTAPVLRGISIFSGMAIFALSLASLYSAFA